MACLARISFEVGANTVAADILDEAIALVPATYTRSVTGSPAVQSTTKKVGNYALKCPTGANFVTFKCGAIGATTVHFHKFWFQYHKQGSHITKNFWSMDAGAFGFHVGLYVDANDKLVVRNNETSPSTDTGSTTLTQDTWYEVQIECKNAGSPNGYIKVWLNGTLEVELSSVDLIRSVGAVGGVDLGYNLANGDDYFWKSVV